MMRSEFTIEDVARGRTMTITDLHDLGGQVFECNKVRTTTARGVERRSSRTSQECGTDRPAKKGPFLAGVFATATQYSQNSSSPDQHADLPMPPPTPNNPTHKGARRRPNQGVLHEEVPAANRGEERVDRFSQG